MSQVENTLLIEKEGQCLFLTLKRENKKNALNTALYKKLTDALISAEQDQNCHCVALQAMGDDFCAGNDLTDFMNHNKKKEAEAFEAIENFLGTLSTFSKPLIAAVQGKAIGIGTTLLFHCDYVLASDDILLRTPFTDLGLVPEAGSSFLAPQIMGYHQAFKMLALGEVFNAEQAEKYGLISLIVPKNKLQETLEEKVSNIALKPVEALKQAKSLLKNHQETLQEHIALETDLFKKNLSKEAVQMRLKSFFKP